MTIEIIDWLADIEREQEACIFETEDPDPHCVLCGRQCSHTRNNWHPGPVLRMKGWFEAREYHDPGADVFADVKLSSRGESFDPGMPLVVTGCELIDDTTWRYAFHGQKYVGVDRVTRESV